MFQRSRVLLSAVACLAALIAIGCQYQPYVVRGDNVPDPLHSDTPHEKEPDPVKQTRWKYIVVHHSATDGGNAADFDRQHKDRGWKGVGYHFVIGNGTRGTGDGEIETTFRWTKQLSGAHCKAGNMNVEGIGICLVGDFCKGRPSPAQMRSLVSLIKTLQRQHSIPTTRIVGHNGVRGAITQCPGSKFDMGGLHRLLRAE